MFSSSAEVLKLGFDLDAPTVEPVFERVSLSELAGHRPSPEAGKLNCYVLSPLHAKHGIPARAASQAWSFFQHVIRRNSRERKQIVHVWGADRDGDRRWAFIESTPSGTTRVRELPGGPDDAWVKAVVPRGPRDMPRVFLIEWENPTFATFKEFDHVLDSLEQPWALTSLVTLDQYPDKPLSVVDADVPSPREAVLARRDALLDRNWPDAAKVAKRLGSFDRAPSVWASRQRADDALFGVWSPRTGSYVHPEFQFVEGGTHPKLSSLLRTLRQWIALEQPEDKKPDRGGWERVLWLYQPHPRLSEQALALAAEADEVAVDLIAAMHRLGSLNDMPRAPAEVFAAHPDAVIALAEALVDQAVGVPLIAGGTGE